MKSAIPILAAALFCLSFAGCEVLAYAPLRDNPNDPGATVVAPPVFDPPAGSYPAAQTVAIGCLTSGATIRYSIDGTVPTSSSGLLYVSPVAVSSTLTLRAIAYKSGLTDSTVAQALYSIQSAKALTSFGIVSPAVAGMIDENAHAVAVAVPYGSGVANLVATFTTTGSAVRVGSTAQVSGVTANDFTNPVTYTVVAADSTTQNYVVTVTVSPSSAKALTGFGFLSLAVTGTITESTHTVAVSVPYGTSVTALVATFTTTGSQVKVGSTVQVSGVTANDFTTPVAYTVVACCLPASVAKLRPVGLRLFAS